MIGQQISHYRIVEELSRGGMGIVYRAVDVALNREVAVKILPPDLVTDPDRRGAKEFFTRVANLRKDGDLDRDRVNEAIAKSSGAGSRR